MHLVKPVDVGGAVDATGAVAPFVVEVVGVPLVDALEVLKKRCLADRYLFVRSADKSAQAGDDIHAALRLNL